MRCRFNAVNFLENPHKRHPIDRPNGRAMGCLLWVHTQVYIMPRELQRCVQCYVILNRLITALNCSWKRPSWQTGTRLSFMVKDYRCIQDYRCPSTWRHQANSRHSVNNKFRQVPLAMDIFIESFIEQMVSFLIITHDSPENTPYDVPIPNLIRTDAQRNRFESDGTAYVYCSMFVNRRIL